MGLAVAALSDRRRRMKIALFVRFLMVVAWMLDPSIQSSLKDEPRREPLRPWRSRAKIALFARLLTVVAGSPIRQIKEVSR